MFRERDGSGIQFKYRAVDAQASSYPPVPSPPSRYSYFTEQAIRAGYMAPGIGRMHENFQNPLLDREAIQRELEKERIREEIIVTEIARRRVLEAEVRREMMLERELALRGRGGEGFDRLSFLPRAGMKFEPRDLYFGQVEGRSLEERIAMSLEERVDVSLQDRLGNRGRHEIGSREIVPFQERNLETRIRGNEMIPYKESSVEPKISEVTLPSAVSKQKEKIVFLAQPEANLSGVKRKSLAPLEEGKSELPSIVVTKKKVKEEWSCAICQVSATSERGLNEHLEGKKHKSKETALRAQRKGKNFGIGIRPKKAAKPTSMLGKTTKNSSAEQAAKSLVKLLQSKETGDSSLQIVSINRSRKENELPLAEVTQKADVSKNDFLEADGETKVANKKKKFKFWCEMCLVGAYSENVMEAHRTGKKHVMRLEAMKNKTLPTPDIGSTEVNNADKPTKVLGNGTSQK